MASEVTTTVPVARAHAPRRERSDRQPAGSAPGADSCRPRGGGALGSRSSRGVRAAQRPDDPRRHRAIPPAARVIGRTEGTELGYFWGMATRSRAATKTRALQKADLLDMYRLMLLSRRIDDKEIQLKRQDRKSTRLNSSHPSISYAVFCLKKQSRRHHRGHRTCHRRAPRRHRWFALSSPAPPQQLSERGTGSH